MADPTTGGPHVQFFGGTPNGTTVSLSDADFLGNNATYKVVTSNGRQYVSSAKGEVFVIVTGSGKNLKYQVTDDLTKVQAAYIKEYAKSGSIAGLKKALFDAKYLSKADYASGNYIGGLVNAITDLSVQNVAGYAYENKTEFTPLTSFLSTAKSANAAPSQAGTKTVPTTDLTDVGDAYREINNYMMDTIGREATAAEKAAYYADIHAREVSSTRKVTTTTDATGKIIKQAGEGAYVTQDERDSAMAKVAIAALGTMDSKTLSASPKGSKIATDIASLQSTASSYGIPMSADEALKYIKEGFGAKDYISKQQERLRQQAIVLNPNLSSYIQGGGTVKDIAQTYASYKNKKLGVIVADPMADKDIQDAIHNSGGLLSVADFNRKMQANPLWGKTEEAHNTATDFINTILSSFGFGG